MQIHTDTFPQRDKMVDSVIEGIFEFVFHVIINVLLITTGEIIIRHMKGETR